MKSQKKGAAAQADVAKQSPHHAAVGFTLLFSAMLLALSVMAVAFH
ncbi:hypothetical protein [Algirhabdus cladophorae]